MMDILKVKQNGTWVTIPTLAGPPGPKGDKGNTGSTGPGVPSGGTAGQILVKTGDSDYQTAWSSGLDSLGLVVANGKLCVSYRGGE